MHVYDIESVQSANEVVKPHLMFAHVVTGCGTTYALLMKGEVKALDIISSSKDWSCLEVLAQQQSIHEDIQAAVESSMIKLFGCVRAQFINKQTYHSRSLD